MKVADLFAQLGLQPDMAEWRLGDKLINQARMGLNGLADTAKIAAGQIFADIAGAIQNSASEALAFKTDIARLDIASKGALKNIQGNILDVSDATGVAKESLREGLAQFVSLTGDTESAGQSMGVFARVAQATGAEMNDVAGAAAAMSGNMKITASEFEKGFSILVAGGKAGAVELKDMSKELAKVAPLAAEFAGGTGIEGLVDIGAAFQLVRRGAGSASETTTRLIALQGALLAKTSQLKSKGVDVFSVGPDGEKRLRRFQDIIRDLAAKGLATDELQTLLGSKEALLAFLQLRKVDEEWVSLADSTRDAQDVAEDYAKFQATAAARVAKAWNKVRNAIYRVTASVIDGIGWMIKHWKLFALTFSSLALASLISRLIVLFQTLQAVSIRAAIASAAAWIAANLPFILLAVAIAAVILIVDDLWHAFKGGESVFRDLWLAAKEWLGRISDQVDLVAADVADFLGFDSKAEGIRNRIANKRRSEENKQRLEALDRGKTLGERIKDRQKQIARLQRNMGQPGVEKENLQKEIDALKAEEAELKNLAIQRGESGDRDALNYRQGPQVETKAPSITPKLIGDPRNPLTAKFLADPQKFGSTPERTIDVLTRARRFQANVTVNATTNADAGEIADRVKGAVNEAWDEKMREAESSTR